MRILNNDVELSNGTLVSTVLANTKTPMTMVLSVKNGKARLSLPDDYYKSSENRSETADRIADGLITYGQTIKAIIAASPEDAEALSPRTYRVVKEQVQVGNQVVSVQSQKSTFAIWFNPEEQAATSTVESELASITNQLLELNPDFDFGKLNAQPAVALGQLRHALRAAKTTVIETASQEQENQEEPEEAPF